MNQWRKRSGERDPELSLLVNIDPNRVESRVQLQESSVCFIKLNNHSATRAVLCGCRGLRGHDWKNSVLQPERLLLSETSASAQAVQHVFAPLRCSIDVSSFAATSSKRDAFLLLKMFSLRSAIAHARGSSTEPGDEDEDEGAACFAEDWIVVVGFISVATLLTRLAVVTPPPPHPPKQTDFLHSRWWRALVFNERGLAAVSSVSTCRRSFRLHSSGPSPSEHTCKNTLCLLISLFLLISVVNSAGPFTAFYQFIRIPQPTHGVIPLHVHLHPISGGSFQPLCLWWLHILTRLPSDHNYRNHPPNYQCDGGLYLMGENGDNLDLLSVLMRSKTKMAAVFSVFLWLVSIFVSWQNITTKRKTFGMKLWDVYFLHYNTTL